MQATEAILLRKIRFGDTSLIVTWLTKEHGKVKTIAKGALRPKSGFAGRLDLFFTADVQFAETRTSELHPLREVSVISSREGLRSRFINVQTGSYFVELLESALEPGEPVPEIYDLLTRALDYLAEKPATVRALEYFEQELARLLGVFVGEKQRDALGALAQVCGHLPPSRKACIEILREREE